MGIVCDLGRLVRICPLEALSLPPAGEHPRVHVPRAPTANQRKCRITGQLSGPGIDQHRVDGHAHKVISFSGAEVSVSLGVRHNSYFPVIASYLSADFKFLLGYKGVCGSFCTIFRSATVLVRIGLKCYGFTKNKEIF